MIAGDDADKPVLFVECRQPFHASLGHRPGRSEAQARSAAIRADRRLTAKNLMRRFSGDISS
ncbi:hypothetical protein AB0A94_26565 [Streptomyces sp. NPDC044984]|uniref:hypothetical protein n=1 Tax=Streptomyces sp. NPDC044984 TaxID=3154335 RepID=UPI0033C29349